MRQLKTLLQLTAVTGLMGLAACVSSSPRQQAPAGPAQPTLDVPAGAQSVNIAADPATIRATLIASAQQKGTPVIQDQANMVVMERVMSGANPALDAEFGPSDNGTRVIRIRVRFTGSGCQTLAVQDVAVVNNVHTALEQSFVLPGNPNTMESLNGLKRDAERKSACPRV
ncbi:hypothetical protein [Roseibium suaedae]|uniref:Lipoprotein n=1 Tax=Roseibium suaedae TaxID=735517 RepID=A0A1M7GEF8_9HYPH|nr:hypothetical protein [Roseibium suaedae]SHM14601.1 hypothetical protein SAMN05444272_1899 [Roseibium suaedae]